LLDPENIAEATGASGIPDFAGAVAGFYFAGDIVAQIFATREGLFDVAHRVSEAIADRRVGLHQVLRVNGDHEIILGERYVATRIKIDNGTRFGRAEAGQARYAAPQRAGIQQRLERDGLDRNARSAAGRTPRMFGIPLARRR
jgi:hypothetical protein